MIDMPLCRGEDDGSTFTCSNSIGKAVIGSEDSGHSLGARSVTNLPQKDMGVDGDDTPTSMIALSHWSPGYEGTDHDEFLAFCLDGFLAEFVWPEEEVVFELAPLKEEKKKSKKAKTSNKGDVGNVDDISVEKGKKSKTAKPKKSKSLPSTSSKRRTTKPSKKRSMRRRSTESRNDERKKNQHPEVVPQVDAIPLELIRKESVISQTESSSDAASFFDDESEIGSLCALPSSKFDDESERLKLRISMIQAAADAASLGRLTRLHEKVVESIAEETPVRKPPVDSWQLKTCAAETDSTLDRSVHQQVLHEAAALGRMKRVKKTGRPQRSTSLHGWAENEEDEKQQLLDAATSHGGGRRFKRRPKKDLLLSSHERMDQFVADTRINKKTTLYDPEHVLEKQHQDHENFSRLIAGDMAWLPTSEVPAFVAPRSYLSNKRVRACVVTEVAKACAVRNHRLQCNFQLNITRKCMCPYCKAPSALQTYAYQQLGKQQPKSETPKRFNSAPTKLQISNAKTDPSELYSRSILRRAETQPNDFKAVSTLKNVPSWVSPTLKKAEKVSREDVAGSEPPIWALVTGDRDTNDLPEWASPVLRDLVATQSVDNSSA